MTKAEWDEQCERIIEAVRNGFMTCVSSGNGCGYVRIDYQTLEQAQDLHKRIVEILASDEEQKK